MHDTDPQATGVPPLAPKAMNPASERTAEIAAEFVAQAQKLLADEKKANGLTLRGFSAKPQLPSYEEVYGLQGGRDRRLSDVQGPGPAGGHGDRRQGPDARRADRRARPRTGTNYDFFFIHFKYTDSTAKTATSTPRSSGSKSSTPSFRGSLRSNPTVLIVTGDHSTPSLLKSHSWHPVPTLLVSEACRTDRATAFGESEACCGGLGQFEAKYLMPLALANAGRLGKFGA